MPSPSRWTTRTRVLVTGAVVALALVAVGALVPAPYVGLGPGVTYNTLSAVNGQEVITFQGKDIPASVDQTFPDQGHLNMTTISVTNDDMTLFESLGWWFRGDTALVPREDVYPPGKTVQQVNELNKQMFTESRSAAELAALEYLKYPEATYAGNVLNDAPSAGKLQPQDRITTINGSKVTDVRSLLATLSNTRPGQQISVGVVRDDKPVTVRITLGKRPNPEQADPAVRNTGFLGIEPVQRPYAPFTVNISLDRIGGPSAGLMFTLGVIDKLTPGDLTSGHFIAGTGEIDPQPDGSAKVGPIGGILMKMIAARRAGATVFLVPAANCQEALTRVPEGLELVRVGTLTDAMTAMDQLGKGQTPRGC
ncbi:YlbL family protein [Nakamurella aerolata]|uniref:PDZ domain-containing protein n=1 Tax=Nakamurella aerolata TaxID=1656892 RepID=A0A849AD00_9ACTN|nr:PDZ domain-containing protein [Nakamurella aerolata]NNG37071.1 PDZ domain-containing protein [Nakamurella aerolata]